MLYAVYFRDKQGNSCDLYIADDEPDAYRQFCLEHSTDCIVQHISLMA